MLNARLLVINLPVEVAATFYHSLLHAIPVLYMCSFCSSGF
jgi:hypothetical protein